MEIKENSSLFDSLPTSVSFCDRSERRAWARKRAENVQTVSQYMDGCLLRQYPEHKQCLIEAIKDEIGLLLWNAFEILKDSEKACDCTTDALAKACKSLERRPIGDVKMMDLKSWLCQCVRRRALTTWQREKRLKVVSLQSMVAALGSEDLLLSQSAGGQISEQPEQVAVQQDVCQMLVSMIFFLSAQQAYAILAHYLDGQPYRTVATGHWHSEKAVNMAVSRGLKKLRVIAEAAHLRMSDFQLEHFKGGLDQASSDSEWRVSPMNWRIGRSE